MTQWRALPTRQPGEALSKIEYRMEPVDEQRGERYATNFRHRDNRIWQARIEELQPPTYLDDSRYTHMIELTSAGCRTYTFMSLSLDQAKRTINRFANMPMLNYNRLISDAQGTTEHPRPGVVGVFRMRTQHQERLAGGRTETRQSEINGIAYNDGAQIIVFPTTAELTEILAGACATGTTALVPQGINQIQAPDQPMSFATNNDVRRMQLPDVVQDEVEAAIQRLRGDTTAGTLSRLQAGEYVATPRQREERVLDIFDDK